MEEKKRDRNKKRSVLTIIRTNLFISNINPSNVCGGDDGGGSTRSYDRNPNHRNRHNYFINPLTLNPLEGCILFKEATDTYCSRMEENHVEN